MDTNILQASAEEILGQLLDDVDVADINGAVLHKAADLGHSIVVRSLLQNSISRAAAGFGVSLILKVVSHAFLAAAKSGHAQCMDIFLALYPPCDLVNDSCALQLAASNGYPDCIRLLLHHNPENQLAAVNAHGDNALILAASNGHAECVQLLLVHNPAVQVAAANALGSTALILAASNGHAECVQLLLVHNPAVQVATANAHGDTALILAAWKGHAECVQLLLVHNPAVQVAAATARGDTALIMAVSNGHAECVQLLLAHNPVEQVSRTNSVSGNSALKSAAFLGHVTCVKLLIVHSPHTQQLNSALINAAREYQRQVTAASGADLSHYTQCMELLLSAGGTFEDQTASASDWAVLRRIMQDLANRALVTDRVNEAVVSLALTCRKRKASSQDQV